MKKYILTNIELYWLADQIARVLQLRLNIETKFRLSQLATKVNNAGKDFFQLRDDTIREIDPAGNIPQFIIDQDKGQILNPKLIEFDKKMEKINEEKNEIEFRPIPLEWLGKIETDLNFPVLYKFFEVSEEEPEKLSDAELIGKAKNRRKNALHPTGS